MKKKLIVANWKMNPSSVRDAKKIFGGIKRATEKTRRVATVVCPPFVHLGALSLALGTKSKKCALGAQDVFWIDGHGSFTGEISALQLKEMGSRYVIIGHSERRRLGETNEVVNRKAHACIRAGLTPIICVGESKRDSHGNYYHFLENQIKESLAKVKTKDALDVVVAYEPIWAIGEKASGADTPDELFQMTIFIRKILRKLYPRNITMNVPILYGGSANNTNAEGFLRDGGVQGLLVGRASLDTKIFGEMLNIADKT
jgi:triosephosphate isomerase (TIM)